MKYVLLAVWCHPPAPPSTFRHYTGLQQQTKQMPRDNNLLGLISNYASDSGATSPSQRQMCRLQTFWRNDGLTLCVWSVLSPNIFLLWLLELSSALAQETMKDVINEIINHFLIKCQNKFPCLHREYIFFSFFINHLFMLCWPLFYLLHKTQDTQDRWKKHNWTKYEQLQEKQKCQDWWVGSVREIIFVLLNL